MPPRRPDITPRAVAERYLEGHSILALSVEFDANEDTIQRRLKLARELYPHLSWEDRKPQLPDSNVAYINMKDGDPRARGVPSGSIVKARSFRRS